MPGRTAHSRRFSDSHMIFRNFFLVYPAFATSMPRLGVIAGAPLTSRVRTRVMPFTPTRRVSRRFPAVFRIIAVLFLFVGGLLAYLDAQETAARRIALSQGAPVPRALEDVRRTGADNVLGEVSVLANSGAPRLVSYRSGGRRQTALVYPLLAAGGQAVRASPICPSGRRTIPPSVGWGPCKVSLAHHRP